MRRSVLLSFSVAVLLGLTACSGAPSAAGEGSPADAPSVEVGPDTIVLDVRTPEEYAAGHLEGARLIDFNAGDIPAAIPNLDPDAEYLLYCRSGNRSGQALSLMEAAGFSQLTNLGSLDQAAAATGIAVVQ